MGVCVIACGCTLFTQQYLQVMVVLTITFVFSERWFTHDIQHR